jgi:hypothetical protein
MAQRFRAYYSPLCRVIDLKLKFPLFFAKIVHTFSFSRNYPQTFPDSSSFRENFRWNNSLFKKKIKFFLSRLTHFREKLSGKQIFSRKGLPNLYLSERFSQKSANHQNNFQMTVTLFTLLLTSFAFFINLRKKSTFVIFDEACHDFLIFSQSYFRENTKMIFANIILEFPRKRKF